MPIDPVSPSECDALRAQVAAARQERDAAVQRLEQATAAWDAALKNRRKVESSYSRGVQNAESYGNGVMQAAAEYADARTAEDKAYARWLGAPAGSDAQEASDYAHAIEQLQLATQRWEQANERYHMYEEELRELYEQLGPAQQAERTAHAQLGEASDRLNAAEEQLRFVSKEFRERCPSPADPNGPAAGGATGGLGAPAGTTSEESGTPQIDVLLSVSWKDVNKRFDGSIPATFYTLEFTLSTLTDESVSGPDPSFGPDAPANQPARKEIQWTRQARVDGGRSHYGCSGSAQFKVSATLYVGMSESELRTLAERECTWCGPWGTPELI